MKIIYVQHAQREESGKREESFKYANNEDIDEFGIKEALDDIVNKYDDKSTIICVSSGINC